MKHTKIVLITIAILIFSLSGTVFAQDDESYTIGVFVLNSQFAAGVGPFLNEMAELGYIEGDVEEFLSELTEFRYAEQDGFAVIFPPPIDGDMESIPEVVQSLLDAQVDVIFTPTQADAAAVMEFNDEIPIVFAVGADPIGIGIVESLNEPGGNVTGIASLSYQGRRMQILLEIDPTIERVLYPYNPEKTAAVNGLQEIEEVAESLGIEIVTQEFVDLAGLLEVIQNTPEDIDSVFLSTDLEHFETLAFVNWIGVSTRLKVGVSLPAYAAVPGFLMGYGPNLDANGILAAHQVDEILRGADPAIMPVQNSEYGLMVSLIAAEALDIDIPRSILRQAEIIMRANDE